MTDVVELLDTKQAAAVLRVTPEWLAAAARRGDVRWVRFGRYRRFTHADLAEFVERQKVGGDPMAAASRRRRSA